MGDFLFGPSEEKEDDSGLKDMLDQQRRETSRLTKIQTDKEEEENAQRGLNRRGRKSLMSAKNTGAGFFQAA